MSEAVLQSAILIAITALPDGLFWRANSGIAVTAARNIVRFNVVGCSDIVGCHRGRFVAIEVKTAAGRQTEAQRKFQAAVERAGGIYIVGRSIETVLAALR